MWQCPQCGRTFKTANQSHFCGNIGTVDEYIAAQPEEVRPLLEKIRETIRAAAPDAVEKISYQMPTFWQGKKSIHLQALKSLSIFPGDEAPAVFADRLAGYKTSKGTIQFPLDKPIDFDLIADITRWKVEKVVKKKK